jgi:hypothetical protein
MADSQILQLMLPFKGAVAVTTSDTVNLANPSRGLYVGGAGNISALMLDGTTGVFSGATAGTVYALRVKRINATGTTATNMVALY